MHTRETPPITIYAYSDFRLYLKDFYRHAHALDRNFSHRFIAMRMGVASSGWFTDLLKGRVNLARKHLIKLVAVLCLDSREAEYLETLVAHNQSVSVEEKLHYFRKLLGFKEYQVDLVGKEKLEFYSQWYYSAIRELLFFHDFQGDYAGLAKRLAPPISTGEARKAIKLLLKLDFIRKNAQGRYQPREATLRKDASFKSLYAANFLKATMVLGMQALDNFPKEDRRVSALTLSYSRPVFRKAIVEIEALRTKLVSMMDEDPHPEKVFQFNLQFFPVTK